jgi:hypothetical protein
MFVGEDASLRDLHGVGILPLALLPLAHSGESSIVQEGQTPPLGLFIVLLKDVKALALDVLPFGNRFLDELDIFKVFPENVQESGLAAADVALNSK